MIWDCITFNNELDLLEIRLNVLNDIVDKFVIIEAVKSHRGFDKPLYFNENKERYKKFENKIVHIILKDLPEYENSWTYENYQRDCLIDALKDANDEDIIMISDADEIPNPKTVMECKNLAGIKSLLMYNYVYFINNLAVGRNCTDFQTTKIVTLKDIRNGILNDEDKEPLGKTTFTKIKFFHGNNDKQIQIKNGGWHFTSCGGIDVCKVKFLSNAMHDEETDEKRAALITGYEENLKLRKLWGEREPLCIIKMDDFFPAYITKNKNKYSHLIKSGIGIDIRIIELYLILKRKIRIFSTRQINRVKNILKIS